MLLNAPVKAKYQFGGFRSSIRGDLINALGATGSNGLAVSYGHHLRVQARHSTQRNFVSLGIKVKRGPAGAQCRPCCDGISGEQNGPLWPVKSQMPRRVARRV